jgi:hypothetical protein
MAALRRNWRTDAGIAGDITQALAVPRSRANSRTALRQGFGPRPDRVIRWRF